jgi:hypothetical protein
MKNISKQNLVRNETRENPTCFHGELDPYWVSCLGYLGNDLVIRVLLADSDAMGASTIPTDAWKRILSRCHVSVTVGRHLAFRSAFNSLVKPLPLKESADWTEQELLFYRMQLFRAHNASLTCPGGELKEVIPVIEIAETEAQQELCVDDTTHNSDLESIPQKPQVKSGVPCSCCSQPFDAVSEPMPVGSRILSNELARIKRAPDLIRPPE